MSPLKVFVSYAHEDAEYKNDLKKTCIPFERANKITLWIDDRIQAGDEFDKHIRQEIETADMYILLLSSNYWASEYINDIELPLIIEEQKHNNIKIIPILINGFNRIKYSPLSEKSLIPRENNSLKAINDFDDKVTAWDLVFESIDQIINSDGLQERVIKEKKHAQAEEKKTESTIPKVCLYFASPLNNNIAYDRKKIISLFRKYNVELHEKVLNEDELLDSYEFDQVFIFSKTNRGKIILEDEHFIQKSITLEELAESLDISSSIIFLDKNIDADSLEIIVEDSRKILRRLTGLLHQKFSKGKCEEYLLGTELPDLIDRKNLINFVGRNTDIQNIIKKILMVRDENMVLTIKGSGGLGKTTIISKAVIELSERGKYGEGIKFIQCEYIKDYEEFENKITFAFDMDNAIDFKAQVKDLLDEDDRLIILDNIETILHLVDTEKIKELIRFISDYSTIIMTTREVLNEEYEDVYELHPLTTDESEELFTKLYPIKKYDKKLLRSEILENYLNNNPLAIKLVTKNLPKGKNLKHLIDELHDSFFQITSNDIEKIFEEESDLNIERTKSLFQSINYSYQKLSGKEKLAMEILSLFPDGIPLEIFMDFYNKDIKNHKVDRKGLQQRFDNFSDRDIKSLENKSLIINSNNYISLQSIIGRFADYRFSQRKKEEKTQYYEKAYAFNYFLSTLTTDRELKSFVRAKLFDRNKNNFLKSLDYLKYLKKNENIYEYIDKVCSDFSFSSSPNEKVLIKLKALKDSLDHDFFMETTILLVRYFFGDFVNTYKEIKEKYPLNTLKGHVPGEDDVKDSAILNLLNIYGFEGYPYENIKYRLNYNDFEPMALFVLGEYGIAKALLDQKISTAYDFFDYELMFNMGILDKSVLEKYVATLYKTQHIEKMQSHYTLLKIDAPSVKVETIKKLIITNPFTDGLKSLMLAMKSDMEDTKDMYEQAIEKLYHIRYYYVEAILIYSKYLEDMNDPEYFKWLQKGKDLAIEHKYRYLQHQFMCLEKDKYTEYDEKNYPLPEKLDYSGVIKKYNLDLSYD